MSENSSVGETNKLAKTKNSGNRNMSKMQTTSKQKVHAKKENPKKDLLHKLRLVKERTPQKTQPKLTQKELNALPKTEYTVEDYNDLDEGEPVEFKIRGFAKLKDFIAPGIKYLINMQLRNGMHRTFVVSTQERYFRFMKGMYIIDPEMRYYHIDSKQFALDYNQDFSLPIKREFNIENLKDDINVQHNQVENSTNPALLKEFLESKVAEGVMRGQRIDDFLRRFQMLILISLLFNALTFVIILFGSGILSSIKIPGF